MRGIILVTLVLCLLLPLAAARKALVIGSVAWYDVNSGNKTHPVGQKQANEPGIHDMSGNIWEWCWDWYDSSYYGKSPSSDPKGAGSGSYRLLRGGSWSYNAFCCRVTNRSYYFNPCLSGHDNGFRLVRAIWLEI